MIEKAIYTSPGPRCHKATLKKTAVIVTVFSLATLQGLGNIGIIFGSLPDAIEVVKLTF